MNRTFKLNCGLIEMWVDGKRSPLTIDGAEALLGVLKDEHAAALQLRGYADPGAIALAEECNSLARCITSAMVWRSLAGAQQ